VDDEHIQRNVAVFMGHRGPGQRYASFDYCFNYFQAFREQNQIGRIAERDKVQLSCLQLGFYLASWGMFRSSALRTRSLKQFEPVIELIAHTPRRTWDIDAQCYSTETCSQLTSTAAEIRSALQYPDGEWPTNTLVTKIMLGVFGNVPAFDNYVVAGLRAAGLIGRFGFNALSAIGKFYQDHHEQIDQHRGYTLDFGTGTLTERRYTRAKVIDEIFYIEGGGRGTNTWWTPLSPHLRIGRRDSIKVGRRRIITRKHMEKFLAGRLTGPVQDGPGSGAYRSGSRADVGASLRNREHKALIAQ
jgi:hypothetical protein